MIQPVAPGLAMPKAAEAAADKSDGSEIGRRFEQMLWAEMLSHAGLEKAFTQNGGEAASAFSRYIVEAIAEDIAAKHPLGLSEKVDAKIAHTAAAKPDTETDNGN